MISVESAIMGMGAILTLWGLYDLRRVSPAWFFFSLGAILLFLGLTLVGLIAK